MGSQFLVRFNGVSDLAGVCVVVMPHDTHTGNRPSHTGVHAADRAPGRHVDVRERGNPGPTGAEG